MFRDRLIYGFFLVFFKFQLIVYYCYLVYVLKGEFKFCLSHILRVLFLKDIDVYSKLEPYVIFSLV